MRPSARVILLDPQDRVLLLRVLEPERPEAEPFWITPGGGIEGEETFEECARREVREETGIEGIDLGPCVWLREHTWPWEGRWIRSIERFYVARTEGTVVTNYLQSENELQVLTEHRWWTVAEMREAAERLVPQAFAELAAPLVSGDWPLAPVDVGE